MVNDIQLRFVCRTDSGVDNKLYITDTSTYSGETVQIKIEIIVDGTVYYVDNSYSHPQGGEKSYNVPIYESKIKNGTYAITAYFKEGVNETTVTKNLVLDYNPPLITPKLIVDGMASIIYGQDDTTTPYQHVKSYKHTKPDGSYVIFSDNYNITPIQSGTHRLDIYHDITVTNINYELRDYISGYTEVVAYKLNETDIYSQLVSYKRAYAQEANPSVRRNMLKVINQLDRYEDDYFMSKRIKDSLTAYDALKNIYLTLNEATVVNVEDIPVWSPSEGGVTAHDQLTEASRSLPNQHPIAAITNLGTTLSWLSGDISFVQSDLDAHKIATNPHNITPAGIGALSKVEHDISLTGDGTAQSPLSADKLALSRFVIPTQHLMAGDYIDRSIISQAALTNIQMFGYIYYMPFMVDKPIVIDEFWVRVATPAAGGRMQIGLYNADNALPTSLIVKTNDISQDVEGVKKITISDTILQPFTWYVIGFTTDNSTVRVNAHQVYVLPTIKGRDGNAASVFANNYVTYVSSYNGLPTNAGEYSISDAFTSSPQIMLRIKSFI